MPKHLTSAIILFAERMFVIRVAVSLYLVMMSDFHPMKFIGLPNKARIPRPRNRSGRTGSYQDSSAEELCQTLRSFSHAKKYLL